jgi:hypothetical protein
MGGRKTEDQGRQTLKVILRNSLWLAALGLAIGLLLTGSGLDAEAAEEEARVATLTLLPNFANGEVEFQGSVSPGGLNSEEARLSDWGIADDLRVWKPSNAGPDQPWSVQGVLREAELLQPDPRQPEEGVYLLRIGPVSLGPEDKMILLLPFLSVDLARLTQEPDNLALLEDLHPSALPHLEYGGSGGAPLLLEIPFLPIRQNLHLSLTPLLGEALMGREASFRFYGEATFEAFGDYAAFLRHCQVDPANPLYRYREAHNLFAVDFPPVFNVGFLNNAYRFKPTFGLLRSELTSCEYQPRSGEVKTVISGRAFSRPQDPSRFPPWMQEQDVPEMHISVQAPRAAVGSYQIQFGEVRLGPGESLILQVPHTNIGEIHPEPDSIQLDFEQGGRVVFEGPRRFALSLRYTPQLNLFLQQAPSILRELVDPVERAFGQWFSSRSQVWTWAILGLGMLLLLVGRMSNMRGISGTRNVGPLLIGGAFFFGFHGAFGWLLLACLGSAFTQRSRGVRAMMPGAALSLLSLLTLFLDTRSRRLFTTLSNLDLTLTPFTPLLLSLLTAAAAFMFIMTSRKEDPFSSGDLFPLTLFFLALSVYDVMHRSLLSLLVAGVGFAFLSARKRSWNMPEEGLMAGAAERMKNAWRGRFVPLGLLVIVGVAAANGFTSTNAVLSPRFGVFALFLTPFFLLLSLLLTLFAIGVLYTLLYPTLPGGQPYVKAVTFGVFLWSIFVLGVGGDDRLIASLGSILVGRLIFYLSVPVLISLHFQAMARIPSQEKALGEEVDLAKRLRESLRASFSDLKSLWATLSAPISVLAPAVYSAISGQPMFSSYFDLLDVLIQFSAGFT